ncbi:hypothetical protein [Paracoccus sp. (in: a-proteobacteria)]|uniref:hypothetical protein n=1 Tax=Paracoccus sp. TaxID=267 RepID=UPI0026DFF86F|nr:hypothetical protein [Paracoccus sp. (in: a-proteobacteria)]MDO5647862.1 hypothetical protein [Paracoccus sp. (in: a-proteobacteria)]
MIGTAMLATVPHDSAWIGPMVAVGFLLAVSGLVTLLMPPRRKPQKRREHINLTLHQTDGAWTHYSAEQVQTDDRGRVVKQMGRFRGPLPPDDH